MDYDEPLIGDEIAALLQQAGMSPAATDSFTEDDLITVLLAEGVTAAQFADIIRLGGARTDPGRVWPEPTDDWRGLVRLLIDSDIDTVRHWRNHSDLTDAYIYIFHDELSISMARHFHDANLLDLASIDSIKDRFAIRGINWSDVERWYQHGLIDGVTDEDANTIAKWMAHLGQRAFFYAAAGIDLAIAKEMDARGEFDEQALNTLAALRRPGDRLALVPT